MSSRSLSAASLVDILAEDTSEVWLWLLEVDNADLGSPLRYVNDTADLTHGGNAYTASGFDITLPLEASGDRLPTGQILVDGANGVVVAALRALSSTLDITVTVVRQSDPNTAVIGPLSFEGRAFGYTATEVALEISVEPLLADGYPDRDYVPSDFPGLFGPAQGVSTS